MAIPTNPSAHSHYTHISSTRATNQQIGAAIDKLDDTQSSFVVTLHYDPDRMVRSKRRKTSHVNYEEVENRFDDVVSDEEDLNDKEINDFNDDPEGEEDFDENLDDDDDDDFPVKRSSRQRQRQQQQRPKVKDEDDDSFHEDESEEDSGGDFGSGSEYSEDERLERQREERQFIVKDSGDEGDSAYGRSKRSKRSRSKRDNKSRSTSRHATRSSRRTRHAMIHSDEEDEAEEEDTIQDELNDLQDTDNDAPNNPKNRSLRQRTKEVNYTIPPPLTENLDGLGFPEPQPSTPRRRAGGGNNGSYRRLFPTGGPFGGGDVTSIFGKNYANFTGTSENANLLAGGADSDSSDDEIVPVSGAKRPSISAPVAINKTPKKKQNADSDPLGVDMNIDFSSIGGLDNYINQLKEMVALPLLYPEVYQKFGITPPRGVLFHGPPGTGKTLMARALAASCSSEGRNITFFMRKGADCLSKWVGEAERQLRLLFEEAKKQQPSIIFFDEIDGLAPVRSSKQEQIHASIVSTMLALMDGMDNRGQVIVIGATNRPDAVDPALRRPGRFDREFYFPLPDIKAREQILSIHTKKWDPPLSKDFLEKVAHLTKGYGGADLRALCTEAALNSIQRRYPQIYSSSDKLKIDPDSIHVAARDFMKALDKIVPSSARSTSSGSAPLPDHLTSLLSSPLEGITNRLDKLVPRVKKLTSLEEASFVDPSEHDADGGFGKHELLKRLEASRVHRPRLLIAGEAGNGQQYLGSAVLNHLEGFNIQSLDLGQLFGDSTRTAENSIIQSFVEARRHKPSIIFIPNVDIWYDTVPESAKSTLAGLLRSVASNERILLLGVADTPFDDLQPGLKMLFGLTEANYVSLVAPNDEQRREFFKPLWNAVAMKPTEFLDNKKKKKLEKLEKLEVPKAETTKHDLKAQEKADMILKNTIKVKLAGLMDLFKNRYKRFKKPPIDDAYLVHLFEPQDPSIPTPYIRDGDMILEVSTGRRFYNMDLDIVEERLWNGFYCEPKQFVKDIEMIYKDSQILGDRERMIKASEMLTNAQVGVQEVCPPEFIEQCKDLRRRQAEKEKKIEEDLQKLKAIEELKEPAQGEVVTTTVVNGETSTTANGDTSVLVVSEARIDGDGDVGMDSTIGPLDSLNAGNGEALTNGSTQSFVPAVAPPVIEPITSTETETTAVGDSELKAGHDDAVESSEDEPELPEPEFIYDRVRVEVAQDYLVTETAGLTVDDLEQVNAKLMDIVWEHRHDWDRTTALNKIGDELAYIQKEFGSVSASEE